MVVTKRGALSPDQIALLILAIVGFALAALFLFGVFDNKDLSERELCRLSVLSRATVPGVLEDAIPLNCYTEKICITAKKGVIKKVGELFSKPPAAVGSSKKSACKQFAGEENFVDIEVVIDDNPINQKESAKIIQSEIANSMFDCWTMTGQGKLDIWTSGGDSGNFWEKAFDAGLETINLKTLEVKPKCLVCSRVAFSDYFYQENNNSDNAVLKQLDYNLYLSREKVPGGSLTYLQTFTDESVGAGYSAIESNETNVNPKAKDGLVEEPKSSNQIAIVFTQMKISDVGSDEVFWNTFKSGAVVGGVAAVSGPGKVASFLLPGPGWIKALFKVATIGAVSYSLASSAEGTTKNNQALSAATCGTFESKVPGEQKGCSLVKLMDWNVDGVNGLCKGGIEGNL